MSVDTGGGYNLRHRLKALSVILSCIINNTTNSKTRTRIPPSPYAVALSGISPHLLLKSFLKPRKNLSPPQILKPLLLSPHLVTSNTIPQRWWNSGDQDISHTTALHTIDAVLDQESKYRKNIMLHLSDLHTPTEYF